MEEIDALENLASPADSPEEQTLREATHLQLRQAVAMLPSNERLAISLYYFHEKSYDEVA